MRKKSKAKERGRADYKRVLEIQRRIGLEKNLDKLLPLIMTEITLLLNADRSTVYLIEWNTMDLYAKFAEGLDDEIRIKLKMGIAGTAILCKTMANITNASAHPYFNPDIDQILQYKTNSILVAPVLHESGTIMGGIELLNKKAGRFSEADEKKITEAAEKFGRHKKLTELSKNSIKKLTQKLINDVECERGSFFTIDESSGELYSLYAHSAPEPIRLSIRLGIAGLCAVTGKTINIANVWNDARFDRSFDIKTGYRTKSLLCVPLKNQNNEAIGVIEVINKCTGNSAFDRDDSRLLEGVASIIAMSIENALLIQDHEKQFRSLIKALAASIDAKDPITAGHSERVAYYASAIAKEIGFMENELDVLNVAALLHDYGKIGIDDAILRKQGVLTKKEYEQMKQHVDITKSILQRIHFARKYRDVPIIASSHHEYLDGSGYNTGLMAKDIPFLARIITVADVFEALTAERHYRKAMSTQKAVKILEKDAKTKFDVHAIKALKKFLSKRTEKS